MHPTLYIVRHGETDWNAERRYQGQVDVPLNARGRLQAQRNGEALAALMPAIAAADFVASPLGRARETMEILRTALGLDQRSYVLEDRLKELSYGHWEGKLEAELPRLDPRGLEERARNPYTWRPTSGESYADLMVRVLDWLKSVERDTLVAAHGGVMRTLSAHLLGLDPTTVPTLEAPQDRVMVLRPGHLAWL
jgi:probable phosphoglycerate mutase